MKREKVILALDGARGHQVLSARVIVDMPVSSVAGFTMVELMITIIILCILLGLAIPGFSSWLPKYRLRGAVRDIYSNFQYAKMTAVKDRAGCGVLFDRANSLYRVVSSGPNRIFESTSSAVKEDDVLLRTVNFSEYGSGIDYGHGSATLTAATPAGTNWDNEITFDEDGVVFDSRGLILKPAGGSSAGGYVYVQNNKNNTYAAGVWTSGIVVMRRWTGSAWQQ